MNLNKEGVAVLGLRTQESETFLRFFSLVQAEAEKQGKVFFLDCGEGRDIVTDEFSGEDLSGWLISQNQAKQFEEEWKEEKISEKWEKYYCFAIWGNENNLKITFKSYC